MYSLLSLLFATGAYWERLALTTQNNRNPLNRKGKSHFFGGLSGGGAESGGKMVCLPISPLPQRRTVLEKYNKPDPEAGSGAGFAAWVHSKTPYPYSTPPSVPRPAVRRVGLSLPGPSPSLEGPADCGRRSAHSRQEPVRQSPAATHSRLCSRVGWRCSTRVRPSATAAISPAKRKMGE